MQCAGSQQPPGRHIQDSVLNHTGYAVDPPLPLSYTRLTQENGRFRQFLKTTSARRTHPWAQGLQFQEFSHLYSRTQVQ